MILKSLLLLLLASKAYALSPMHERRDSFAAVLLKDGRVLVAGGESAVGSVAEKPPLSQSCEIFDPKTEGWEMTGSLIEPVYRQNAVSLSGGQVLMVGGETGPRAEFSVLTTAQAELYDPHSKSWKKIDNAPFADSSQDDFSALIAFGDGLAALIGGLNGRDPLSSVSFFNVKSAHWTPDSEIELDTPRMQMGATVLQNGRLLVVGGWGGKSPLSSAEYYDPVKEKGGSAGKLRTGRQDPQLVVLNDGQVLAIGGQGVSGKKNIRLVSVELFSPKTMKWTPTGSMTFGRFNHTASLLSDGRVLVAGGDGYVNGKFVALDSVEIYNPETGKWSSGPPLKTGRSGHHAFTLSDGRVFVVGGHNSGSDALKSVEIYDPKTNSWLSSGE